MSYLGARIASVGVVFVLALSSALVTATSAEAAASATKCTSYGGPHDDCITVTRTKNTKLLVTKFKVKNTKKKKIKASCAMAKTYTESYAVTSTTGASVTGSAEFGGVFGLAKATLSASVSKSVSKSRTSASATSAQANATTTLKPGKALTCKLYIHDYQFTVKRTYWPSINGVLTKTVRQYSAKIPNYFEMIVS